MKKTAEQKRSGRHRLNLPQLHQMMVLWHVAFWLGNLCDGKRFVPCGVNMWDSPTTASSPMNAMVDSTRIGRIFANPKAPKLTTKAKSTTRNKIPTVRVKGDNVLIKACRSASDRKASQAKPMLVELRAAAAMPNANAIQLVHNRM